MELPEQFVPFLKEHAFSIGLGVLGLICLGYGLITLINPPENTAPNSQEKTESVKAFPTSVPKQITIDVEGAVQKAGVYTMPADSRIQDALITAGGLSQNADRQRIAQTVNFALPLTDGAKIYFPAIGEQYTAAGGGSSGSSGTVAGAATQTVNINQASETELDALPGVGPVTAQKIVSNRPYQSVQDLLDKKVVGASEFQKIKDMVSVY